MMWRKGRIPAPDAESLPFYALVLKLVVCVATRIVTLKPSSYSNPAALRCVRLGVMLLTRLSLPRPDGRQRCKAILQRTIWMIARF